MAASGMIAHARQAVGSPTLVPLWTASTTTEEHLTSVCPGVAST
jgi:hypothetical protein